MANPVLIEVTRGGRAESLHRGSIAVSDPAGKLLVAIGEVEAAVFPRSAVKAIQAIPLVESGAADAFGFGARELALAQASHWGEGAHVEGVAAMLAAIGLAEPDLECGCHAPFNADAEAELIRRGEEPSQLHNNCSGKHANFLAFARYCGIDHRSYVEADHPVQVAVREALASLTGAPHDPSHGGTDGCSIPTYAVPLAALARGFARFATGIGLEPERARAARRIYAAAVGAPFYVAGTGRFDTLGMQMLGGAALLKTGAEGVYCAALPGRGVGVALKCEDGSTRGAQAIMAALLARLFPEQADGLRRWWNPPVLTRRDAPAGELRPIHEAFAPIS